MLKTTIFLAAAVTTLTAAVTPVSAMPNTGTAIRDAVDATDLTDNVALYVVAGRRYCFYFSGWHGPGWYRCGFAFRRGLGWGGTYGWQGWDYGPAARRFGGSVTVREGRSFRGGATVREGATIREGTTTREGSTLRSGGTVNEGARIQGRSGTTSQEGVRGGATTGAGGGGEGRGGANVKGGASGGGASMGGEGGGGMGGGGMGRGEKQ